MMSCLQMPGFVLAAARLGPVWLAEGEPDLWLYGLGALVVLGLVLWAFGAKLAKLGFVITGMVIGTVIGLAVGEAFFESSLWALGSALVGMIGGALMAWLVYRFWVGASTALLLAVVAPCVMLVFTGGDLPDVDPSVSSHEVEQLAGAVGAGALTQSVGDGDVNADEPVVHQGIDAGLAAEGGAEHVALDAPAFSVHEDERPVDAIVQGIRQWTGESGMVYDAASGQWMRRDAGQGTSTGTPEADALFGVDLDSNSGDDDATSDAETVAEGLTAGEAADAAVQAGGWLAQRARDVLDVLDDMYAHEIEQIQAWWANQGDNGQKVIGLVALAAGAAGLVLGLFWMKLASAVQTALIGSLLMVLPGRELLRSWVGDDASWLPQAPRMVLLTVLIVTGLGVAVQCMALKKKADRQSDRKRGRDGD